VFISGKKNETLEKGRTKQEIRKRNGKRILIAAIIVLILVVLFYFWYPAWAINQLFDELLGH
jgi:cell division septal protein FtsQ